MIMGLFSVFKKNKEFRPVDEINLQDSKKFKKEYMQSRVPVLLKGVAKSWPLFQKWNKKYISENMGSYICNIIEDSRPAYAKEQTTLKFYFENLENISTLTLDPFYPKNPPLFYKDIKVPNPFFTTKEIDRFFFFHSVKDAGTLPHIHGNAFNILQEGQKEWVFYDASEVHSPNGYSVLQHSNKKYPVGSHAKDWFKKEMPKLPSKVKRAYRCIQEAGDIIFIPSGYCHAVLNKSEVMGIVFETH